MYHPHKSLSKNSSAMVQRWSVALGAYRYTIEHRSAKHIQHADFLSRHFHMSPPDPSKDCLLIQPVPINRTRLIQDTRRYFGVVMKSLRTGWRALTKKKFPQFYARRENLSATPDGLLCLNDRTRISPTLRRAVLDDLHSSHLGVEKMKS